MSGFLLEIIMAVAGALCIVAGRLFSRDWQRRVASLMGLLLFLGAVMSALMELSTSMMWDPVEVPDEEQEYQPGTLIPELAEGVPISGLTLPELDADLATAWTPEPLPTLELRSTSSPEPSRSIWATDTPGPTNTPGPPTPTPRATETASPAPINVTPVTVVPVDTQTAVPADTAAAVPADTQTAVPTDAEAASPTVEEPTRTPRPQPTPEPDQRRLSLTKLNSDLRGVAVTNVTQDTQQVIFELGGRPRYNPIYSAAWSPDGRRVVIAYGWLTSEYDRGIRLQVVNADGTGARDILSLPTAGLYRGLGNALWNPTGDKIVFAFHDGPDDGVWEINPDGSGLRRVDNSVPGEWPRYWTVDGAWLITIAGDNVLYALEMGGSRRLPLEDTQAGPVYDPRYHPWRSRGEPRCELQEDSWWKCK